MDYYIDITAKKQVHLVEWLRFIQDSRPIRKINKGDICILDFRNASFLYSYHICSIACLIEEFHINGAKIQFKYKSRSGPGRFIHYTKFDKYWNKNFDRNNCFLKIRNDVIPVWQLDHERIDPFADLAEKFYSDHCLPGKDLSILRLSVVEALNNIQDHSESKVKGFVFSQYFPTKSKLVVSICDFGVGIPNKVNTYLKKNGEKELSHPAALQKAFELNFTTKSRPNNAGKGLDTILTHVKTTDGEIQVVTNKAIYSNKIKDSKWLNTINDEMNLSFNGTCISIELNTNFFVPVEKEIDVELDLF